MRTLIVFFLSLSLSTFAFATDVVNWDFSHESKLECEGKGQHADNDCKDEFYGPGVNAGQNQKKDSGIKWRTMTK